MVTEAKSGAGLPAIRGVFKLSSKMVFFFFFFLKCEPEQEAGVKHLSAQLGPVILPMLITRAMHLR